ncbi:MAG: UDP-3-O-(3-hydroxymyristoyl)glucosamine N-acyltransferase [Armatimonadota bacterium]|nr:UDP-3-O-(3-hydroxymyristoyl)glucosamine N-acyltransferase [bacterium]MCS7309193.1 UDP-3-O-(3-hydroxymyristoyl)glucosamine N-acyltransferase [Armatimonadota bacterium]MDW8103378.1 UDP-3-O-(3-hydroxymyristoyl)glucosamine N-acyltransferase [Armatimonadota bacterium]MDW8289240.1 UDP-3-O-(3-hydroxymyristoyl)glucosamine N-acyltransferase [Armatimonadota bacterium]
MRITLQELAQRLNAQLEGDAKTLITGVSSIEFAQGGDVVFAESLRFLRLAERCPASAVIVWRDAPSINKPLLRVDSPREAFLKVLELFAPPPHHPQGISPSAIVSADAYLAEGVAVGAGCVIEAGACIGRGTVVYPLCYVGRDVQIGEDCILYPHVTLMQGVRLGNRVIVHPGSVIGSDGFGYVCVNGEHRKVPHLGTVEVGDDVEIGANVCIDRAKTGVTRIGSGTKIDNLVHIAHNVQVGEGCLLIAQVGIAGSSRLGRSVVLAGQVGVSHRVTIGDGAVVAAQSGVAGNLAGGQRYFGSPAREHMKQLRLMAYTSRLPELFERVKAIERQLRSPGEEENG